MSNCRRKVLDYLLKTTALLHAINIFAVIQDSKVLTVPISIGKIKLNKIYTLPLPTFIILLSPMKSVTTSV